MANKVSNYLKNNYIIVIVILLVAVIFIYESDRRNEPSERVERAVEDFSDGVEDAADELKPNRSLGEKVGDKIEDIGDDIKDSAD